MADLPSEFWGGWIVTITVASFVALLWFVIDVYRSGPDGNEQQVWDETLREGTRPAPIWWFWFILALMIISVIYVMLYPGLGTYRGALGWSMGGRIEERFVDYEGQFGTQRRLILKLPLAELANSNSAMRSASRVFNNNCSSCHGRDAAGQAQQFPDLTDAAWQWGSDESQIVETIHSGRQAAMPGWLAAAGEAGVGQLADYVLALSRGDADATAVAEGAHRVPAVLRGLSRSRRRRQSAARRTGAERCRLELRQRARASGRIDRERAQRRHAGIRRAPRRYTDPPACGLARSPEPASARSGRRFRREPRPGRLSSRSRRCGKRRSPLSELQKNALLRVHGREIAPRLEPDRRILAERHFEPERHRAGEMRAVVGVRRGRGKPRRADPGREIRLGMLIAPEGQGTADVQVLDVDVVRLESVGHVRALVRIPELVVAVIALVEPEFQGKRKAAGVLEVGIVAGIRVFEAAAHAVAAMDRRLEEGQLIRLRRRCAEQESKEYKAEAFHAAMTIS